MRWKYQIESGSALREAIDNEETELVIECLVQCYKELLSKLSVTDKDLLNSDIEDDITLLEESDFDDNDEVNYYLEKFYDLCDYIHAFITF